MRNLIKAATNYGISWLVSLPSNTTPEY